MLKALIKKQASELFAILFLGAGRSQSKRKKKKNSGKKSVIVKGFLFFILFAVIFVGVCFWALAMVDGLVSSGYDWIYFLLFGIFGLFASIAFNVFISYNMIFRAKDNSLLLSMPIPAKTIVFTRMAVLFMNCIIVNAFAWLPAVLMYQIFKFSALAFIFGILMLFAISMISLAFACLIGWFIAIISRNQITKIILSIVGMIILILVCIGLRVFMNYLMVGLIENINSVNEFMMSNAPFLYYFGNAATGDVASFLMVLCIGLILFGVIYFIMSKTFMFVVQSKTTGKHKVYKATSQKARKISKSLLGKERLFFFKTPVYLINAGLGNLFLILAIIGACFAIPVAPELMPLLRDTSTASDYPFNILNEIIPVAILGIIFFCNGFNLVSAPSISVEGKSLWILKSLPLKTSEIFRSKIEWHVNFNYVPAVIFTIVAGIALQENTINIIAILICALAFNYFIAYLGFAIGLIRANLNWTNIAIPIKQNLAVGLVMIFNFVIIALYVVSFVLISQNFTINATVFIISFAVFYGIGIFILDRWLRTIGAKRFSEL